MTIYINNEALQVSDNLNIKDLLAHCNIATIGTAVAVDNKVISRSQWNNYYLNEGNKVTIIRAVCGG